MKTACFGHSEYQTSMTSCVYEIEMYSSLINLSYVNLMITPATKPRRDKGKVFLPYNPLNNSHGLLMIQGCCSVEDLTEFGARSGR